MEEGKEIELVLTEHDLEGKYNDFRDCPIARALKRKFPNHHYVSGGPWTAKVDNYQFTINHDDEHKLAIPETYGKILPGGPVRLTPLQTVTCDCC